jgi:hypothetical protein
VIASREESARAALVRVKRRMGRALTPDDVPISIPEGAAMIGMDRSWLWRRLTRVDADGQVVLLDLRKRGGERPVWRTTPRLLRQALSARATDVDATMGEIEEALDDLRARVHRLEVLQQLHTDRLADLAPTG